VTVTNLAVIVSVVLIFVILVSTLSVVIVVVILKKRYVTVFEVTDLPLQRVFTAA
jgi:hypothetical protein